MSNDLMPAAFIGHGTPMNALESNRYTQAWREFGASVPRPKAILMVSAHWFIGATAVTTMARPKTIHDFFGFPQALFDIQYPAPGMPELAQVVADAVSPDYVGEDVDSWGIDHGAWSVLVHAFPAAEIPVVQLSVNALKPASYHLALGRKLDALRSQGILVIGSGNVVHNLRAADRQRPELAFDWAERFDEHARQVMAERPGDAASLEDLADYRASAPTPEHFLPLLYIAGIAAAANLPAVAFVPGYAFGSISMTSYAVGARQPHAVDALAGSAPLSRTARPEDSNV